MSFKDPLKIVAILVYVIACFAPAFKSEYSSFTGFSTLIYGWGFLVVGEPAGIAWLSNILFFIAFFLNSKHSNARLWLSGLALLFSFLLFTIKEIPVSEGGASEAVQAGIGAFCWILALFLLLLSILQKRFV